MSDLKQLNQVAQMSDSQFLNDDVNPFPESERAPNEGSKGDPDAIDQDENEEDDDDDFECDIEKYVPFDQKINFSEQLKSCSKECLTEITKLILDLQPQAFDDFGNSRVQLKIDMVERDAYLKSLQIL